LTGDPVNNARRAQLSVARACMLPPAFALALLAFTAIGPMRQNPALLSSFLLASGALIGWTAILFAMGLRSSRRFSIEVVLRM
jgi:hypothetical protein